MRAYLAGPEVFLPDAVAIGEAKKAICAEHGLSLIHICISTTATQLMASAMPGGFCTSRLRRRTTAAATCSASVWDASGTRRRMMATDRSSDG